MQIVVHPQLPKELITINQYQIEIQLNRKKELTFPLELLESNLIRVVSPWASRRLISSTKSGASLMIIAKASGLLPDTKLNVSSVAGAAAGAFSPDARLRGLADEPEPPRGRRLTPPGAEGRWGGIIGKDELRRLAPAPRPAPPPPRPSFEEPPYIGEVIGRRRGNQRREKGR